MGIEWRPPSNAWEEPIVFLEERVGLVQLRGRLVEHAANRVERHELLGAPLIGTQTRDLMSDD